MELVERDMDLGELLRRCGEGSRAAFREVYERISPRLYAAALRITRQPTLADDAVHDALLQIWQNAARFDPNRGDPMAWMISVTRYRALDLVRRHSREISGLELTDEQTGIQDAVDASEFGSLRVCLAALEGIRRQMVILSFVEGYSHSELAERFSVPLGTVKSWVRRGLEALRKCLDN